MTQPKRRWGDRIDGWLVRDNDPMHFFVPYLYPNRADSEAVVVEQVDLTALEAYLGKKNEGRPKDDHYTLMHAVAAALVRTLTLRPKMNYFIKGNRIYHRNHISLAFVVKKKFADNGAEALAYRKFGPETTIDTLHRMIVEEIQNCRSDALDNSTAGMEMFTHLPRWLMRIAIHILFFLDYYGKVPQSLVKTDPNYASVLISNLGSIKLNAGYHHLTNWGTTSFFGVIGERHMAQLVDAEGNVSLRPVLDLGLTIDERIADGYYYSKTVRLLKHLLQHPELLELPASTEVDYEV